MICEKCGEEFPNEYMYCPKCGHAIQIVPDFDLDLDESLQIAQSDVAGALSALFTPDGTRKLTQDTITMPAVKEKLYLIRRAIFITAVLLIIVAALLMDRFGRESVEHDYLRLAEEAYSEGNYEEAAVQYENAIENWDGEFMEALNAMRIHYADALSMSGNILRAEEIYLTVINEDPSDMDAYRGLMDIYVSEKQIGRINELIGSATDPEIQAEFREYMAVKPEFSVDSGEFEEEFSLSLSVADGMEGDIYYTLFDSSEEVRYTEPILISEGKTSVTAVFENKYGFRSEPETRTYQVVFEVPEAPEVSPAPGTYNEPKYISVKVPEGHRCLYTLDGSYPTEISDEYDKIMAMPLGKSSFKFAFISEKGVIGEVTEVNYSLRLTAFYTPEDSVNYVAAALVMNGALTDIYGNAPGMNGHYKYICTKAAMEGSRIYYLVDEYFEEANGNLQVTGAVYAVDAMGGMLYRARQDDMGRYQFTLF